MIETVLGPVAASDLGVVATNEHVLTDSRHLVRSAADGSTLPGPLTLETLGELRWNALAMADNLALDDADLAVAELRSARDAGLGAIVEATSWGMGPRHADLPEISRRAGIHVVAAYGSYIDKTLPSWWSAQSEDQMRAQFELALNTAIPGTQFRAGLLGLLGTSAQITPAEARALRAAAHAAAPVGAAVSIRLDGSARRGPEVLDLLVRAGMPARKVLFCNIDKTLDPAYIAEILDAGAVVEFAFGSENYFGGGIREATDAQRIQALCALLEGRPDAAVTLTCSVWTKMQLTRYGGLGYGHVVSRILPVLRSRGVTEAQITRMLVERPRDLLDRTEITS